MIQRTQSGNKPQITFTCDGHELVTGDLRPNCEVRIRYDPSRIVPEGESYMFGDPKQPIVAHARYEAQGQPVNKVLESRVGMLERPDVDITGQGSMLSARLDIPPDAEEVSIWFSYVSSSGEIHYDSDSGTDYHFGFPSRDIMLLSATVVSDPQTAHSSFAVTVSTAPMVDKVSIRFQAENDPSFTKQELLLQKAGEEKGRTRWSLAGVAVPQAAVIRFKLFYWIGERRYKDDNSGHYYLAPQPEQEKVPAPPAELAKASMQWKT